MNIQDLRQSLKQKWLCYYQQNCHWLEKMQIWAEFDGERRPLSSFVLATVSVLEPNLVDLLPLLVDLNTNPDDMVAALGLNFNPEKQLKQLDDSDKREQLAQKTSYQHPLQGRIIEVTAHNSLQRSKEGAVQDTVNSQDSNSNIQVAVATSYLNRIKSSQPQQSLVLVTPGSKHNTKHSISLSAVATAPPISSSNYKLASGAIPSEVNQAPTMNRRKLANWIDEFCQGRDWDREEPIFITF